MGFCAENVVLSVTDHDGFSGFSHCFQRIGDDISLVGPFFVHGGSGHTGKIGCQTKVFQNLHRVMLRLGGSQDADLPCVIQRLQHGLHAVIDPVFEDAGDGVVFPVVLHGLDRLLPRETIIAHIGVDQRRTHEPVQFGLIRFLNSILSQRMGHGPGDADTGLRQGPIQIEQNDVVHQLKLPRALPDRTWKWM